MANVTEISGNNSLDQDQMDQMEQMKGVLRMLREKWAAQSTIGQRFVVPRDGKAGVAAILYRPGKKAEETAHRRLPVFFNMHGGGWVGGDAVLMESFCQMLADELPAFVVNINYTKADVEPMPYQQEEVADAVRYFASHEEKYGIDAGRIAVGGHSAGAHLACGAAMMLAQEGFPLAAQVLVYPAPDLTIEEDSMEEMRRILYPEGGWDSPVASPARAPEEMLEKLCPALFVLCGRDSLLESGRGYAIRLMDAGVAVKVKKYPEAEHGFLEVNRPDYAAEDPRKTPEQAAYARNCEEYLVRELRAMLERV